MGFLGAAQIDQFGNLNSTVIGDYATPKVRLPGAGGAPHIAAHSREIVVIVRQTPKAFVSRLPFVSTPRSTRHTTVVTDMGILETEAATGELVLTAKHPGVNLTQIEEATGWSLRIHPDLRETREPSDAELRSLRELNA